MTINGLFLAINGVKRGILPYFMLFLVTFSDPTPYLDQLPKRGQNTVFFTRGEMHLAGLFILPLLRSLILTFYPLFKG